MFGVLTFRTIRSVIGQKGFAKEGGSYQKDEGSRQKVPDLYVLFLPPVAVPPDRERRSPAVCRTRAEILAESIGSSWLLLAGILTLNPSGPNRVIVLRGIDTILSLQVCIGGCAGPDSRGSMEMRSDVFIGTSHDV